MSSLRDLAKPTSGEALMVPDNPYLLMTFLVLKRERLSPSFIRITFANQDGLSFTSWGPDQRVKLYLPEPGTAPPRLPLTDWNAVWQKLDQHIRPARRSYTIRQVRPDRGELDIDFVDHGVEGPASAWAFHAKPGDLLQIAIPNGAFTGKPIGFEWRPPQGVSRLLLMGDETSLPAISNILEHIPETVISIDCFVEVPRPGDDAAAGELASRITWLPRYDEPPGAKLKQALGYSQMPELSRLKRLHGLEKSVDPNERMWDPAVDTSGPFYAWVAAEGGAVKFIRHALMKDCGLPKSAVSTMGYWYLGRPFH
ncbi:MAG: siderophore-interacting protein [Henriciella sp.]|nr:siderophore-interacting protein [Henriciella sp.]